MIQQSVDRAEDNLTTRRPEITKVSNLMTPSAAARYGEAEEFESVVRMGAALGRI